jgi:hypothetical protein
LSFVKQYGVQFAHSGIASTAIVSMAGTIWADGMGTVQVTLGKVRHGLHEAVFADFEPWAAPEA